MINQIINIFRNFFKSKDYPLDIKVFIEKYGTDYYEFQSVEIVKQHEFLIDYSNFLNMIVEISDVQIEEFDGPCLSFKTDHYGRKINYNVFFKEGRLVYTYQSWDGSTGCGFMGFNFEVNLPPKSF